TAPRQCVMSAVSKVPEIRYSRDAHPGFVAFRCEMKCGGERPSRSKHTENFAVERISCDLIRKRRRVDLAFLLIENSCVSAAQKSHCREKRIRSQWILCDRKLHLETLSVTTGSHLIGERTAGAADDGRDYRVVLPSRVTCRIYYVGIT